MNKTEINRSVLKRTLLLIEDDTNVQLLIREMLQKLAPGRFLIRSAEDGDSGLRLLRKHDPDVIVLDLLLPGCNGFEILRHMRSARPELLPRTIIITAAADLTLGAFEERSQVRCVLRKPFDIFELANQIVDCGKANAGEGLVSDDLR